MMTETSEPCNGAPRTVEQLVQHGGESAIVHLLDDGGKVGVIAAAGVEHFEHGEAPFVDTGRDHPILIASDQNMQSVADGDRIAIFALDGQGVFGDQALERAFVNLRTLRRRTIYNSPAGAR